MPDMLTASDDMKALAEQAKTEVLSGTGLNLHVRYDGVKGIEDPLQNAYVGLVFVRHFGVQESLAGAHGTRNAERSGIFTIQLFCPMPLNDGLTNIMSIASIVKAQYEGIRTTNGVWFRNCEIHEVGPVDKGYQMNFVAEFNYDEVVGG